MAYNPSHKVAGIRDAWRNVREEPDSPEAQRYTAAVTPLPSPHRAPAPSRKTSQQTKVRENRLRRMAARQGLALKKSPRRDPRALGYGTYMLVDVSTNGLVAWGLSDGYGLDLDEIERELTGQNP
jgi:hypothetical protein